MALSELTADVESRLNENQLVIQQVLGSGAFGTVYKALWKGLQVAVKTMTLTADAVMQGRHAALMEAALSKSIFHPNVVTTYTCDLKPMHVDSRRGGAMTGLQIMNETEVIQEWRLYIVQEFCDGGSLRHAIEARSFLNPVTGAPQMEWVLQMAREIASGLQYLHDHNIIHGDLNPANVLLRRDDGSVLGYTAKIADFGLSVHMHAEQSHVSNTKRGTPFYTAPEVTQAGNLTRFADVFSYGVVLWELYCSRSCWMYGPQGRLVHQRAFPHLPPMCPRSFAQLVANCMQPAHKQRPNFKQIGHMLEGMLREEERARIEQQGDYWAFGGAAMMPVGTAAVAAAQPAGVGLSYIGGPAAGPMLPSMPPQRPVGAHPGGVPAHMAVVPYGTPPSSPPPPPLPPQQQHGGAYSTDATSCTAIMGGTGGPGELTASTSVARTAATPIAVSETMGFASCSSPYGSSPSGAPISGASSGYGIGIVASGSAPAPTAARQGSAATAAAAAAAAGAPPWSPDVQLYGSGGTSGSGGGSAVSTDAPGMARSGGGISLPNLTAAGGGLRRLGSNNLGGASGAVRGGGGGGGGASSGGGSSALGGGLSRASSLPQGASPTTHSRLSRGSVNVSDLSNSSESLTHASASASAAPPPTPPPNPTHHSTPGSMSPVASPAMPSATAAAPPPPLQYSVNGPAAVTGNGDAPCTAGNDSSGDGDSGRILRDVSPWGALLARTAATTGAAGAAATASENGTPNPLAYPAVTVAATFVPSGHMNDSRVVEESVLAETPLSFDLSDGGPPPEVGSVVGASATAASVAAAPPSVNHVSMAATAAAAAAAPSPSAGSPSPPSLSPNNSIVTGMGNLGGGGGGGGVAALAGVMRAFEIPAEAPRFAPPDLPTVPEAEDEPASSAASLTQGSPSLTRGSHSLTRGSHSVSALADDDLQATGRQATASGFISSGMADTSVATARVVDIAAATAASAGPSAPPAAAAAAAAAQQVVMPALPAPYTWEESRTSPALTDSAIGTSAGGCDGGCEAVSDVDGAAASPQAQLQPPQVDLSEIEPQPVMGLAEVLQAAGIAAAAATTTAPAPAAPAPATAAWAGSSEISPVEPDSDGPDDGGRRVGPGVDACGAAALPAAPPAVPAVHGAGGDAYYTPPPAAMSYGAVQLGTVHAGPIGSSTTSFSRMSAAGFTGGYGDGTVGGGSGGAVLPRPPMSASAYLGPGSNVGGGSGGGGGFGGAAGSVPWNQPRSFARRTMAADHSRPMVLGSETKPIMGRLIHASRRVHPMGAAATAPRPSISNDGGDPLSSFSALPPLPPPPPPPLLSAAGAAAPFIRPSMGVHPTELLTAAPPPPQPPPAPIVAAAARFARPSTGSTPEAATMEALRPVPPTSAATTAVSAVGAAAAGSPFARPSMTAAPRGGVVLVGPELPPLPAAAPWMAASGHFVGGTAPPYGTAAPQPVFTRPNLNVLGATGGGSAAGSMAPTSYTASVQPLASGPIGALPVAPSSAAGATGGDGFPGFPLPPAPPLPPLPGPSSVVAAAALNLDPDMPRFARATAGRRHDPEDPTPDLPGPSFVVLPSAAPTAPLHAPMSLYSDILGMASQAPSPLSSSTNLGAFNPPMSNGSSVRTGPSGPYSASDSIASPRSLVRHPTSVSATSLLAPTSFGGGAAAAGVFGSPVSGSLGANSLAMAPSPVSAAAPLPGANAWMPYQPSRLGLPLQAAVTPAALTAVLPPAGGIHGSPPTGAGMRVSAPGYEAGGGLMLAAAPPPPQQPMAAPSAWLGIDPPQHFTGGGMMPGGPASWSAAEPPCFQRDSLRTLEANGAVGAPAAAADEGPAAASGAAAAAAGDGSAPGSSASLAVGFLRAVREKVTGGIGRKHDTHPTSPAAAVPARAGSPPPDGIATSPAALSQPLPIHEYGTEGLPAAVSSAAAPALEAGGSGGGGGGFGPFDRPSMPRVAALTHGSADGEDVFPCDLEAPLGLNALGLGLGGMVGVGLGGGLDAGVVGVGVSGHSFDEAMRLAKSSLSTVPESGPSVGPVSASPSSTGGPASEAAAVLPTGGSPTGSSAANVVADLRRRKQQ